MSAAHRSALLAQFATGSVILPKEYASPQSGLASRCGWLTKRGGHWRSWQRRWVVLAGGFLYYFATDRERVWRPKGVILVGDCAGLCSVTVGSGSGSGSGSSFGASPGGAAPAAVGEKLDPAHSETFVLHALKSYTDATEWKNREYLFRAESDADRDAWVAAILATTGGSAGGSALYRSKSGGGGANSSPPVPLARMPHSAILSDDMRRLFLASRRGDVSIVTPLLTSSKMRERLTTEDEEGNTPLHWAAVEGNAGVVGVLLDAGVSVDRLSRDGFSPLQCAVQEDRTDVVALLLRRKASVSLANILDNDNTALHYAAAWGSVGSAKLLLDAKSNVDARAADGSTPLAVASANGHASLVSLLLSRNADIEARTDHETKGRATPLHLASLGGHIDVVRLLLDKDRNRSNSTADAKATTADGMTVLHLAVRGPADHSELVKLLLACGADASAKTAAGDTALHYAAYMNHSHSVTILLEAGANVSSVGQNRSTPLHFAARQGAVAAIKVLIAHGAAVSVHDADGETPLTSARVNGHADCVKFLQETAS